MALKFNVEGRDVGSVVAEAQALVGGAGARVQPPDGHYFVWGGEFENQQRAMARLRVVVPVALLIVLVLLYSALGSACSALAVLATAPFALNELERTDLALAALASRHDEALTDVTAASGALAAAVGLAGWQPRAAGPFEPPAAPATAGAPGADHPELVAGAAALAAARRDEDAAHAEAVPTPSLQVQGFGTTDPQGIALAIGVAIPLPVFDRNQGAIARARAQQRAAELDHRAAGAELTAELARATAIATARGAAVARFRADAIERLPHVRAMAEASYRSGQGGIVALLDALDAITEAHLREIELIAAALDAELDVRAAAHGR